MVNYPKCYPGCNLGDKLHGCLRTLENTDAQIEIRVTMERVKNRKLRRVILSAAHRTPAAAPVIASVGSHGVETIKIVAVVWMVVKPDDEKVIRIPIVLIMARPEVVVRTRIVLPSVEVSHLNLQKTVIPRCWYIRYVTLETRVNARVRRAVAQIPRKASPCISTVRCAFLVDQQISLCRYTTAHSLLASRTGQPEVSPPPPRLLCPTTVCETPFERSAAPRLVWQ